MGGVWIFIFLIAFILGGVFQIIKGIPVILQGMPIVIIYLGMFVLLFKIFQKIDEKIKNRFFFISYILIMLFWLLGPFYLMELTELDKNNVYMNIFGQEKIVRFSMSLFIAIVISIIILLISCICKYRILQSVMSLMPSIFLLIFLGYSTQICAKSYSDNTVSELAGDNDLVQYVIQEDTKIYYTAWKEHREDIYRFPIFSPIKYAPASFQAGDIVYADLSSWRGPYLHNGLFYSSEDDSLTGREYVKVTDGKKAGFVKTSALRSDER